MLRTLIALLLLSTQAFAGGYGNRYYNNCSSGYCAPKYVAPVVAPTTIIQNQNVFYSVGQEVRYGQGAGVVQAESQQIQREMGRLIDRYQAFTAQQINQPQVIEIRVAPQVQQVQQYQQYSQQYGQAEQHCDPSAGDTKFNLQGGVIAQTCAKCHSGNTAKGDFHIDGSLTCEQKFEALRQVLSGNMPKGRSRLDANELSKFFEELAAIPLAPSQAEQPRGPEGQPPVYTRPVPDPLPPQDQPPEQPQAPPPIPPQSDRPSLQPQGDEGFSQLMQQLNQLVRKQ